MMVFCSSRVSRAGVSCSTIEICKLSLLCKVVEACAGPDWKPGEVWLQTVDRRVEELDLLAGSDIHLGASRTGILIPESLLATPVPDCGYAGAIGSPLPLPRDFAGSLTEVIVSSLSDGAVRIDGIAKRIHLSARTLQRRLERSGVTFSQLVDAARLQFASRMLSAQSESTKISDVAFAAGYSDHAHFTRAFRRVAGVTPSQFRRYACTHPKTDRWLENMVNPRFRLQVRTFSQRAAAA